ncbi:MAG: hypothetical protein A2X86_16000 [Bdellovibrionales bacterium GWA2_49_15]|nr:MAG: hypothetical protein A2X86_16000 [Bdellovibrionales bacterium GWA2_49_15]HAZ13187.1 UDP-3-O-(3-hydroxymyristoyl)glucosamine N-acyltransferase [Bdellovibrionales bacterium]
MEIYLSQIKRDFDNINLFRELQGIDCKVTGINAVEFCMPGDLVFVEKEKFVECVLNNGPSAIVTTAALATKFFNNDNLGVLTTDQVKVAHALLKEKYCDRDYKCEQWAYLKSRGIIHPTAQIAESSFVGPNVIVGEKVIIGENCKILSGVVIEDGVVIGSNTIIHPNAVIGYSCRIGDDVIIGPGSIIGSEGFGFAEDKKMRAYRIPQTGIVEIHDRVRIGALNTIDRAAYGKTIIGEGTKTDNLCHFAHNVEIGKDCQFTAMFAIAGSSKVGDRVMSSGQCGVIDHVSIASDTFLVHRAAVYKDIKSSGMYAGIPSLPFSKYVRSLVRFKQLSD